MIVCYAFGVSSSTRLLVLGVVRIFQPVHGYDVRRELLSWRAQEWASVKPGSIYNALKTLTRDGLIEVVGTNQIGNRPERTTYRLTAAGNDEFRSLLREAWWTVRAPLDPLMAAVSLLGFVQRSEAIAALEHRTAHIQGMLRHGEYAIAEIDGEETPDHVREMMRLMSARIGAELAWSKEFVARLKSGEYHTSDDAAKAPKWADATPKSARSEPADAERPARGRDRGTRREPADRTRKKSRSGPRRR